MKATAQQPSLDQWNRKLHRGYLPRSLQNRQQIPGRLLIRGAVIHNVVVRQLATTAVAILILCSGCPSRDAVPNEPLLSSDDRSIVILMIGDGMGPEQLRAASLYRHGTEEALSMHSLPVRGHIVTGSASGLTDSAAAATAMATGRYTFNGVVGIGRDGERHDNLVEIARAAGLSTGVVTTSEITHATPASFTAHVRSRGVGTSIADQIVRDAQPNVVLGGGEVYFRPAGPGSVRNDDGLLSEIEDAGYLFVRDRDELDIASSSAARLFGLFAPNHLPYALDRTQDVVTPSLSRMTAAAIEVLDRNPNGFFLMVEGGRIDHAGHVNDLARMVQEVLEFDDVVAEVMAWAQGRTNVTLIVTADHETGGLAVLSTTNEGVLPDVSWSTGGHTNVWVDVFAQGPQAESFNGRVRDHRWIHAAAMAGITASEIVPPRHEPLANGYLGDLRHRASVQLHSSDFGASTSRLDGLRLDADQYGLTVGIEGLFANDDNAIIVLIDTDYGNGSGPWQLGGELDDDRDDISALISRSPLGVPRLREFGIDFVFVNIGATTANRGERPVGAGLRGIQHPYGQVNRFEPYDAIVSFGDGVRTDNSPRAPQPLEGMEIFIPWGQLYTHLQGAVPPRSRLALAVALVSQDGSVISNQSLPPFPGPARTTSGDVVRLPAFVVFSVDENGDWIGDGETPPVITP